MAPRGQIVAFDGSNPLAVTMIIRRLGPADVRAFRRVRLLGFKESPTVFGSSYGDAAKRPLSHSRELIKKTSFNRVFGGFENGALIGIVGLVRNEGRKERHKASILGMYVVPSCRQKGIARMLLDAAIARAKKMKGLRLLQLGVVTSNTAARGLYEKAGFVEYACEKEALLVSKRFYSESLMVKRL